jgi:hypothetical protein
MRKLFLLVFCISIHTLQAQQSIKYNIKRSGRVIVKNMSTIQFVKWQISECIVDNKDTTSFFFLPISNLYDVNTSSMGPQYNGIYGMYIGSKENLIKFAEALIYLGKQKGRKSEKLIIDKINNIELSILTIMPANISIGKVGGFYISKRSAVKLGNTLLKKINYFKN